MSKENKSPYDEDIITKRIVQYIDDPKESSALAKVRSLSNKAKNKSSTNLIDITKYKNINDINTELNTDLNKNLFKEKFQRRKFQFRTQTYRPKNDNTTLMDELKEKKDFKKCNDNFGDNGENNDNDNKIQKRRINKKNIGKKVGFAVNQDINKDTKPTKIVIDDKDKDKETKKIIQYFDDPKDSSALAKVRSISNKAANKTSTNLIHINADNVKEPPLNQNFKRRQFQFSTQVYKSKKDDVKLIDLLKEMKNEKNKEKNIIFNKKEDTESERAGSEDDENDDEDNEFNFDNIEKQKNNDTKKDKDNIDDNINEKEKEKRSISNNNSDKKNSNENYEIKIKVNKKPIIIETKKEVKKRNIIKKNEPKEELKEEPKEEKVQNKNNDIKVENYRKLNPQPKINRERYSSLTTNESRFSRNNDFHLKKPMDYPRFSVKYDSINEDYRKRNNLIIENVNSKEKIIKNEYRSNNKEKKYLKSYKTEYVWDKVINRLIEKRIYFDDNEENKNNNNTKDINNRYNSNTFNTFDKPKKDFNKSYEKEIEINNNKDKKDNNIKEDNSKKYKLLPRLYTENNFKKRRNFIDNKIEETNKNDINNNINKPNYRIYQKRTILKKEEIKPNKPEKNRTEIIEKVEKTTFVKEYPRKKNELLSKRIEKINEKENNNKPVNPIKNYNFKQEKTEKEEQKFKKIPYSQYTNTKKKNIRLNMFSGEDDIFKENEKELKNTNKNNIYNNYMNNKKPKITYGRKNKTKNDSDFIEDLEKIEQYSINTYLKNDLHEIYNSITEEYGDFKNNVFNTNINNVEEKVGQMDENKDITDSNRKRLKHNVNDLIRGKTTTEDIYKKYMRRAIKIKAKVNF